MASQVSSGENKQWHIFRVRILVKYLTKTYGQPAVYSPNDFRSKMAGKKGIIVYEVSGWDDATRHTDLWDGAKTIYKDYGGQADKVLFWETR